MFRLLTLAVSLTALTLAAPVARPGHHDDHFMQCAKACDDCGRICDACAAHCAQMIAEGKKEHLKTLATCADCATACKAASCIVARKGPFSDLICTACADACKRCGDACEQFKDDPMMRHCAEECRKCEKACREMLKHIGPGEKK
jgi:hypothetical protein